MRLLRRFEENKLHYRICVAALNAICLVASCAAAAAASDWGYEGTRGNEPEQDVLPMRAHAQPMKSAPDMVPGNKTPSAAAVKSPFARTTPQAPPSGKGAAGAAAKAAAGKPASATSAKPATKYGEPGTAAGAEARVQTYWGQVYELAGGQKLDDQQRQELEALMHQEMQGSAGQQEQAKAVLKFWPKLNDYLAQHQEQSPNYSKLLRALLRFRSRNLAALAQAANSDDAATGEFNLISEVLGPQRLTVPGAVPFSEEAVDAYSDMACFIYELKNPGKTVDAMDNRSVFAAAVSEKFKSAPTKRDQEAMAAFDLSWAKFKIIWTQADDKQKETLKIALLGGGPGVAFEQVHDPILDLVLRSWPGSAAKVSPVASSARAAQHK